MKRTIGLLALACVAGAQPRGATYRSVWFEDGTALEFQTQSTGATTPLSTSGSIVLSVLSGMHRVVLDKDGGLLFVYGVEAWRDALPQTFFVRIKPVDRNWEMDRAGGFPAFEKSKHPFPTVAAVREFPGVRLGDAIVLDILRNPTTGEKIFDVITPVESAVARGPAAADVFSVAGARVVVNGQSMEVAGAGAIEGGGLAIRLPAKATYYLATEPSAKYSFRPAGKVEHDRLTIELDGDRIELAGNGNLLKNSPYRTIWVYKEAGQSRQYRLLERELEKVRLALALTGGAYTDNHPTVAATRAAMDALERERTIIARKAIVEAAGSAEALMTKAQ